MLDIKGRICQPYSGTTVEHLAQRGIACGEHVRKDHRLGSEQTSIDAERGILRNKHDVPVFKPEIGMWLNTIEGV